MKDMFTLPLIPGWDVAGVIEEKGKEVTNLEIGDSVYTRPSILRNGAYAEYIAAKASEVALKPETIDYIQAAAVPLAALTAWQSIFDLGHLQSGQKILIHAAAGGVGHYAVQFAKWAGAHVIGTASAHNHEFLKSIALMRQSTTPLPHSKMRCMTRTWCSKPSATRFGSVHGRC